jgi:DNA repair protein RecO (recombination protein O)
MPARESEAFILRSYPFGEADLVVSYFTRDMGKLRGIAKGVRRPKSRFGAGLERLAHVKLFYFQKQTVELAKIDKAELLGPSLTMRADYPVSVALDYIAEVAEETLPEHEPDDPHFRLLALTLDDIAAGVFELPRGGQGAPGWMWRPLTYFALWTVRLGGWLPPLDVCLETGTALAPDETAWFHRSSDGLLSGELKTPDSWPLSPQSRALAREMLRTALPKLPQRPWDRETARDLRRFLNQRLESHIEKRLKTLRVLEHL